MWLAKLSKTGVKLQPINQVCQRPLFGESTLNSLYWSWLWFMREIRTRRSTHTCTCTYASLLSPWLYWASDMQVHPNSTDWSWTVNGTSHAMRTYLNYRGPLCISQMLKQTWMHTFARCCFIRMFNIRLNLFLQLCHYYLSNWLFIYNAKSLTATANNWSDFCNGNVKLQSHRSRTQHGAPRIKRYLDPGWSWVKLSRKSSSFRTQHGTKMDKHESTRNQQGSDPSTTTVASRTMPEWFGPSQIRSRTQHGPLQTQHDMPDRPGSPLHQHDATTDLPGANTVATRTVPN